MYVRARTQNSDSVINNVDSDTSFIHCGVPQGSILGPYAYADDTNLTYSSKNRDDLFLSLTHDFADLKQWLDSSRFSLNVLMTKCLFTGIRHKISLLPSEPDICLDSESIERCQYLKKA